MFARGTLKIFLTPVLTPFLTLRPPSCPFRCQINRFVTLRARSKGHKATHKTRPPTRMNA